MNVLPMAKKVLILQLLVEGSSLRSASRIADVSINTVTKLLVDVGRACLAYQDKALRNLPLKRLQVDEIWSFCYGHSKNLPVELRYQEGYGEVWTWIAICPDTKLVPCWHVGNRNISVARVFLKDLYARLAGRVQLITDGWSYYPLVVEDAFGTDVDYGMLVKSYDDDTHKAKKKVITKFKGAKAIRILGRPDMDEINTCSIERQNLTMRMGMRRFTRKTNGHSKKLENHKLAIALHYMYYNFGRIHQTLRVTPAMEAGLSKHVWSLEEIIGLAG